MELTVEFTIDHKNASTEFHIHQFHLMEEFAGSEVSASLKTLRDYKHCSTCNLMEQFFFSKQIVSIQCPCAWNLFESQEPDIWPQGQSDSLPYCCSVWGGLTKTDVEAEPQSACMVQ